MKKTEFYLCRDVNNTLGKHRSLLQDAVENAEKKNRVVSLH